jgi:hypothetical protein
LIIIILAAGTEIGLIPLPCRIRRCVFARSADAATGRACAPAGATVIFVGGEVYLAAVFAVIITVAISAIAAFQRADTIRARSRSIGK